MPAADHKFRLTELDASVLDNEARFPSEEANDSLDEEKARLSHETLRIETLQPPFVQSPFGVQPRPRFRMISRKGSRGGSKSPPVDETFRGGWSRLAKGWGTVPAPPPVPEATPPSSRPQSPRPPIEPGWVDPPSDEPDSITEDIDALRSIQTEMLLSGASSANRSGAVATKLLLQRREAEARRELEAPPIDPTPIWDDRSGLPPAWSPSWSVQFPLSPTVVCLGAVFAGNSAADRR